MRESNIETILINPNIATIQTSHHLASEIYFLPVTADYVAYVLEKERPDGILLTFGGQSALNVGIQLDKMGVLERLGVKVLGTPIRTLEVSEDRDLFVQALNEIEIPAAQSTAVSTIQAALDAAKEIGYPIILRSAFSLGGLGSGFAHDEEELRNLAAKSLSLSPQVLIEKSLKGWKEVEYEVVRAPRTTPSSAVTWRTLTLLVHTLVTLLSLLPPRLLPTMSITCSEVPPLRLCDMSVSSVSVTSSTPWTLSAETIGLLR